MRIGGTHCRGDYARGIGVDVTCRACAATATAEYVIIWSDDIGLTDVSAYSQGLMGFHTPNIDRIAHEGVLFTDYYGEQSCTAGRASFT